MKIIGLKMYQKGYIGCAETADKYVLFRFAHRTCKSIQEYPADAFKNRQHFISTMGKFIRTSFFLKEPLDIESVTQDSLEQCIATIKNA